MDRLDWIVPRSLDEVPRFLFLDLHQLILAVVMLALGLVGGSLVAGFVLAFVAARLYSHLRAGRHPMIVVHLVYWHFPPWLLPLPSLPPAHQRLYLG